ncbi:MAG: hypothetical protein HY700_16165 [Gemmatimonadetes bacterium]|nr:hypothetical protein [Gemmatimonadota bacterium]
MNDIFRERIVRRLESLPDETAYQILDYIEFLESRHGTGGREPDTLQKIAEGMQDTLRAARLPATAVRGTMGVMDAAGKIMRGVAAAGRAAVKELQTPEPPSKPSS